MTAGGLFSLACDILQGTAVDHGVTGSVPMVPETGIAERHCIVHHRLDIRCRQAPPLTELRSMNYPGPAALLCGKRYEPYQSSTAGI